MARFSGEYLARAERLVDRYPVRRSAMLPLFHLAQEQDGWLTPEAIDHIAELVGVSGAQVVGTASFYSMVKRRPVGRWLVSVCTNLPCQLAGADELLEHAEDALRVRTGGTTADGELTLEEAECLAGCDLAPCLQVNYRFFGPVDPDGFDALVDDLRAGRGDVPPHLTLNREDR
ncbi:MAG TPA: NAD(P)H-dependent oxidoreductase subunit E [Acidimicrobiales bacterium]